MKKIFALRHKDGRFASADNRDIRIVFALNESTGVGKVFQRDASTKLVVTKYFYADLGNNPEKMYYSNRTYWLQHLRECWRELVGSGLWIRDTDYEKERYHLDLSHCP
jgi:hypothetical protein